MKPMGVTEVGENGFGFFAHSEQKDLDLEKYASTVTLNRFVADAIRSHGLETVVFREAGFGYQDLSIVRNGAAIPSAATRPAHFS